jgi:NAD(P)-dependent dehydrogenase (short-subunit alcohol dehydrogenase family)
VERARRVVVVGANRPAALECVRQCVRRGDDVVATCEQPSRVPALQDLAEEHARVSIIALDPAAPDTVGRAIDAIAARWAAIDTLIYGGVDAQPLAAHGEPPRDAQLDTLQPGGLAETYLRQAALPLAVLRAFRRLLARGESPRVLLLSSWLGSIAGKTQGGDYALCGALAGLHMLMRGFAHDVERDGIVVLIGNPGPLKTEIEGPAFKVPVDRSVSGLLEQLAAATVEQSGGFVDWNGGVRAW